MSARLSFVLVLLAAGLSGCDRLGGALGLESPEQVAAVRDAEGKAIGGACRHAGRAIEDCYALNKKADKAAIFAGWREMNDYMRENKIEEVPSHLAPTQLAGTKPAATDGDADGAVPVKRDAARPTKSRETKPPAS